ncbi:MAG: urease accessory protein UreD [Beijerinckiaceae bacterium]
MQAKGANSPSSLRAQAQIRASFAAEGGRTHIAGLFETGGWRLRHPNPHAGCEAVILNTGGGVASGDRIDLAFSALAQADVTLTTQAAEKIYRGATAAEIAVAIHLQGRARLEYLPQETILFEGARLRRRLEVDMAADATGLFAETAVFGRLARGETSTSGALHDSWRIRRAGKLIFAEETRIEGEIGARLDRPAIGRGARAAALLVYVGLDAEARLADVRGELAPFADRVEAGASAFNGMLMARLTAVSPDALQAAILAALIPLRGRTPRRVWH